MGGITRRSSTFPDAATLTAIEGVFIVDEAPNLRIEPLDSTDEIVLRAAIGAGAVVSVGGART